MRASPVTATVDFDRPGVQHGHLRLPWSRDDSAWGSILVPVAVLAGDRPGPTALLFGGNHGDEYEGPIALVKLARSLDPARLHGRVIVVPFLNWPAFRAGRRTSPIDGGNMNRSFPGRPDGTPTEKLADFVTRHLLPLADIVLDFHSGGRSLDFLPFAACHRLDDAALEQRAMAAVRAFAAPWSVFMREIDAAGMLDTTAESMDRVFVTTELSGGGTARPETVAIAERGVHNLLVHAGILDAEPRPAPTTVLEMPDDAFLFAGEDGMVGPLVLLGAEVRRGDPVVRLHDFRRTGTAPVEYRAPLDGLLLARHFPGLTAAGDCLAVFARRSG